MSETVYLNPGETIQYTPTTALTAGQVFQLPDGRAAIPADDIAAGVQGAVAVCGVHDVTKASSIVILQGQKVYWDHSADACTIVPQFADRDFYLGIAMEDVAGSATYVKVKLNEKPYSIIDAFGGSQCPSGGDTVLVLSAGLPYLRHRGGLMEFGFDTTAEAQKVDWLSCRSFPITSKWIFEAVVEVQTNGDADVADLSVGVANGTHASDADTIAEACFVHLDPGADLDIMCESDDGTTEVAATDSTVNWAVGTPFLVTIDGRDPTDIQIYIDGVLVLSGTTFTLEDGTGPLKALIHWEKSSNDSPGIVQIHDLRVRLSEEG